MILKLVEGVMSTETMNPSLHTIDGLTEISPYFFESKYFDYVLIDKFRTNNSYLANICK